MRCCLGSGWFAAALTAWGLLGVPGGGADPARGNGRIVTVRQHVVVRSDQVLLGDLAEADGVLSTTEQAVRVLESPPPGGTRQVPLLEIAYALQKFPDFLDLSLQGPKSCTIEHQQGQQNLQLTRGKILDYLKQSPPWAAWKVDVLFQAEDERRMMAPVGASDMQVRTLDSGVVLGKVPLRLVFVDAEGRRLSECSVSPVILREVQVVVMAAPRDRGQVLQPNDLQTMPMWCGEDRRQYATVVAECVGRELSRPLAAGDLVQPAYLLSPECVRRGDVVWVDCAANGLNVRLAVNAVETGRLGDTIQVRNPMSSRLFQVRVTGEKRAVLELQR